VSEGNEGTKASEGNDDAAGEDDATMVQGPEDRRGSSGGKAMIPALLMLSGITVVVWIGYWLHLRAEREARLERKARHSHQ
jgi:hypothetical protein